MAASPDDKGRCDGNALCITGAARQDVDGRVSGPVLGKWAAVATTRRKAHP
jgi:hypothetical protein